MTAIQNKNHGFGICDYGSRISKIETRYGLKENLKQDPQKPSLLTPKLKNWTKGLKYSISSLKLEASLIKKKSEIIHRINSPWKIEYHLLNDTQTFSPLYLDADLVLRRGLEFSELWIILFIKSHVFVADAGNNGVVSEWDFEVSSYLVLYLFCVALWSYRCCTQLKSWNWFTARLHHGCHPTNVFNGISCLNSVMYNGVWFYLSPSHTYVEKVLA